MKKYKTINKNGFTLLELMIAVLIIGIIAVIAFPQYGEYIQRSKITEAQSTLAYLKTRAESFFGDRRTYTDFCDSNTVQNEMTNAKYFTLSCDAEDNTFTLTMTGNGNENLSGFEFEINELNERTSTYDGASYSCWVKKKGDSC